MNQPLLREPFSPDDFYRAFGIAILVWQFVESQLFRFYFSIHEPDALNKAGWAAAGFKDTLLRCQMKKEVANGDEKKIQPRVQA